MRDLVVCNYLGFVGKRAVGIVSKTEEKLNTGAE
jgi:hypothetical protein